MLKSNQVKQVRLEYTTLGDVSSKHLAAWLSGLPDLTELTLNDMKLDDSFYVMASEKAAQTKVSHTVTYDFLKFAK